MKKNGCGFCQEFADKMESIVITAWFDNKRVLIKSNYFGKEPLDAQKRYDKTSKKKRDTERPHSVAVYNKFMGGMDKVEHTKYWSRKWYHQIVFHLFSLAVVNSWLVYQQMGGFDTFLKFLRKICFSLIKGTTQHPGPNELACQPEDQSLKTTGMPDDIKKDYVNHWPMLMHVPNSQQCKYSDCAKKTKYQCSKCKLYLCMNKNICFQQFNSVNLVEQ